MNNKTNLFVCTLYQNEYTTEMKFTYQLLSRYFTVHPIFIEGTFKKGNNKQPEGYDQEEIAQRNKYLKKVPHDEWFLILDSDEILTGNIMDLPTILYDLDAKEIISAWIVEFQFGILKEHKGKKDQLTYEFLPRGRLIKKKEGMIYKKYHDRIYWNEKNILDYKKNQAIIYSIGTWHYKKPEEILIEEII